MIIAEACRRELSGNFLGALVAKGGVGIRELISDIQCTRDKSQAIYTIV